MAAKYMYRIKVQCIVCAGKLPRYRPKFRRFYYCSRSGTNLSENVESIENCKVSKKSVSLLFLSGREASKVCAVVSPELDFNYIIDNHKTISEDLGKRKVTVNLPMLVGNLKVIKELEKQVDNISAERENIEFEVESFSQNQDLDGLEALRKKGAALKDKLKILNTTLWDYEEVTYPELAKLPNMIHSDTPLENEVLAEHSNKREFSFHVKSHIEIGKLSRTLKFSDINSSAYYLRNVAAVLELAISNYFADKMKNAGFQRVINPDFCKSVILEGCGKTTQEFAQCVALKARQNDPHYLTGTASLEGFVSTLSRIIVNNTSLPLQYYSIGRCYSSIENSEQSLFSVAQAVKVTAFVASVESESMKHFCSLLNLIETFYKSIDLPFRIIKVGAHLLKSAESFRVGFDLWSPYKKEFVNVAHVSLYIDYISRRLMIKHGTEKKAEAFLHIVEASVTSLPVLLGCIMENMQTSEGMFSIPNVFKPYTNSILKT